MADDPAKSPAYARLGQPGARSPLVIAVPHAGRHYPAELLAAARLPQEALETIEDRHADMLVADAVAAGAVAIVARPARAYVDLNRDERELDPALLSTRSAPGDWSVTSKVSGGLGVVPSRIAAGGAVWRRPLDRAEVEARIATAHRPYHAALAQALDEAMAVHGIALLIDCHSMPPLGGRGAAARIVIGDRHGRSADPRFVQKAMAVARAAQLPVSRNHPYAGGYTLDRHGDPRHGRHALQIEVDRSLYLDEAQRAPGTGLPRMRRLFARIAAALADEAMGPALAAE
jgi:N-formylglutamate amidohydrolase